MTLPSNERPSVTDEHIAWLSIMEQLYTQADQHAAAGTCKEIANELGDLQRLRAAIQQAREALTIGAFQCEKNVRRGPSGKPVAVEDEVLIVIAAQLRALADIVGGE